jgi:moderate conductance mechanosensitive channel
MGEAWSRWLTSVNNPDLYASWTWTACKVVLIVIISRIAIRLLGRTVRHIVEDRKEKIRLNPRRTTTFVRLTGNVVKYVINFVMVLMILGELGVPIGPILAGAGVLGLAVGFGAQSLVKDVITGFFIIMEDQFAVGDFIQIGAFKGKVEEIGLRVTRIRSWMGEVHIIPNGSIAQVTNFTLHNTIALLDIAFPYDTDVDKLREAMIASVRRIAGENSMIVKQPEVAGIQSIAGGSLTMRVICECKPNAQMETLRTLIEGLKKDLDAHGIKLVSTSTPTM